MENYEKFIVAALKDILIHVGSPEGKEKCRRSVGKIGNQNWNHFWRSGI